MLLDCPIWRIVSDAGRQFRWEKSQHEHKCTTDKLDDNNRLGSREDSSLPSMFDLLHDSWELLQGRDNTPAFRTGSGKSVPVKISSIRKAAAIFGDVDAADRDKDVMEGCSRFREAGDGNTPVYYTGSGKSLGFRQSSLRMAASLLGDGCAAETVSDISTVPVYTRQPPAPQASFVQGDGGSKIKGPFNLIEDDSKTIAISKRCGKPAFTEQSSYQMVIPVIGESEIGDKDVPVAALRSAHALLGRKYDPDSSTGHDLKYTSKLLGAIEVSKRGDAHDLVKTTGKVSAVTSFKDNGEMLAASDVKNEDSSAGQMQGILTQQSEYEWYGLCPEGPSILFHTAGGRSVSVSGDALRRARNLLGNAASSISDNVIGSANDFEMHSGILLNKENIPFGSTRTPASKPQKRAVISSHVQNPSRCRGSNGPFVDVSNSSETYSNQKILFEKKEPERLSIPSPFKRPRRCRFIAPLQKSSHVQPPGLSVPSSIKAPRGKIKVSSRYPFVISRQSLEEFFGQAPSFSLVDKLSDDIKCMNADNAEKYVFHDAPGTPGIGVDGLQKMLVDAGASLQIATEMWTLNHYKWIIWKLSSFERSYPSQAAGKILTLSNVLEELKYRYEREVNHGHRSALKKILEGDMPPTCMMVLCISAIHHFVEPVNERTSAVVGVHEDAKALHCSVMGGCQNTKIELTDGWYSIDAYLDAPLSKQLAQGRIFMGQKLRIWGAVLSGWVAPVSPLEASKRASLLLHVNGTYRAHWASRLGFCKGFRVPLAFSSIHADGGLVPETLVGVTRVYPILYKERLGDGDSVLRSEGLEFQIMQMHRQRCCSIAEGVISEKKDDLFAPEVDFSDDEGANIFRMLETAVDPEVLMAEMSLEQLSSFTNYQAKREDVRNLDVQKKIRKALDDAGIRERDVTCLVRVRVVNLTGLHSRRAPKKREGLITIWNPPEELLNNLSEGQIYCLGGLVPLNLKGNVLYLQARGSSIAWRSLPPSTKDSFLPFFSPRKAILLSDLGQVPLSCEFDIAAVIVYAGEVYKVGHQKKQWVFLADGSLSGMKLCLDGISSCLLAVNFSLFATDDDSFAPVSLSLVGSTVGFCNLTKQQNDPVNHIWVAEAREKSAYYSYDNLSACAYLREAACAAHKWAESSSSAIQKLQKWLLHMVGGGYSQPT